MAIAFPFATWHTQVSEKKHLQRAAEKVVNRWNNLTLAVPLATWNVNVLEKRSLEMEKRRLELAAAKVVARWQYLVLARPWMVWARRTDEKKRLKLVADQVVRRWTKTDKAPAFNSWKNDYLTLKKRKICGDKIISRWMNLTLSTAWNEWSEVVAYTKKCMRAAKKVVLRWTNLLVVSHFEHWQCLVEDRRWAEQKLREQNERNTTSKKLEQSASEGALLQQDLSRKDKEIQELWQNKQLLLVQISDLEQQNLLNWTRWTETRRQAEEQADKLTIDLNSETEKLADLQSKYNMLLSDVSYLQTRLDAKTVLVSLLKGNLNDAVRDSKM
jgi:hypothetical protein